jgi:cytochrome c oxidase subunit 2
MLTSRATKRAVPGYRTGVSCAAHADPVKRQLMGIPLIRMIAAVGSLTGVLTMTGCARTSVASISGAELFEACVPCHGAVGEGNTALGAPAIAGLPAWYVSAQLERFQTGVRGQHADDVQGLRMQAMSRQLRSEMETMAVATHVASLRHVTSAAAIGGSDAAAGQRAYLLCASCHGVTGSGFEAGKVPPLAGMDDWYVAAQIRKFKNGVRGMMPGDAFGPVMQAVAAPLSAEDINQVAAYVHVLSSERGTLR